MLKAYISRLLIRLKLKKVVPTDIADEIFISKIKKFRDNQKNNKYQS